MCKELLDLLLQSFHSSSNTEILTKKRCWKASSIPLFSQSQHLYLRKVVGNCCSEEGHRLLCQAEAELGKEISHGDFKVRSLESAVDLSPPQEGTQDARVIQPCIHNHGPASLFPKKRESGPAVHQSKISFPGKVWSGCV